MCLWHLFHRGDRGCLLALPGRPSVCQCRGTAGPVPERPVLSARQRRLHGMRRPLNLPPNSVSADLPARSPLLCRRVGPSGRMSLRLVRRHGRKPGVHAMPCWIFLPRRICVSGWVTMCLLCRTHRVAQVACTTGYYSGPGATNCTICPLGYKCANPAAQPQPCPLGTYAPLASTACLV